MSRFPLFLDTNGARAVVIGGGAIAARRVPILLRYGFAVTVIAPHLQEELQPLADQIDWQPRRYQPGDCAGARFVTAVTNDRAVNHAVSEECRKAGIFASIADSREESTAFFPAIAEGAGVLCGLVSAEGKNHAQAAYLAQRVRELLQNEERTTDEEIANRKP